MNVFIIFWNWVVEVIVMINVIIVVKEMFEY